MLESFVGAAVAIGVFAVGFVAGRSYERDRKPQPKPQDQPQSATLPIRQAGKPVRGVANPRLNEMFDLEYSGGR